MLRNRKILVTMASAVFGIASIGQGMPGDPIRQNASEPTVAPPPGVASRLPARSQLPTGTRDLMDMMTTVPATSSILEGAMVSIPSSKNNFPKGPHDWLVKNETIQQLLVLHNKTRANNGLPPLRLNPRMCVDAQKHAVWMAKTGFYQHSGLPYAEIIFAGPTSPEAAVAGWINSPPHYGIMLSGSEAGFGYMVIGGRTYWVGVFR